MQKNDERQVEAFDYELGQLLGVPGVTNTKQATVLHTNGLTESSTWIVQTFRKRDVAQEAEGERSAAKDAIFVQFIGKGNRAIRLVLPAPVAELIARQREQLTTKSRLAGARQAAATRKERGIVPAFLGKRRKKGGAK
jgi:hypothetical protein